MATLDEQNKLVEVLKFTPRTYKIQLWGYGGEVVMGTVDREIYDYFKRRRLDLSSFAWESDYAEENNIPEEMQPFPPGSWYECDNITHANGVARNAGTIQIEDEKGETIYEKSLDDINGWEDSEGNPEPEWSCSEEFWIDEKDPGTVVFIGRSNEKGTFFEGNIDLTTPFDISKLVLGYDEVDGEEIINRVEYDGVEIDNWGGSTDGKSSDFGMYIAGSQSSTGKWEKYTNMDDIEYEMTEWFPKKINPAREGVYMVKTSGKNSYTYQARWNGESWHNTWADDDSEPLKIKEWQGLANDPDEPTETEQKAVWPYASGTVPADILEKSMTEETVTESKWWSVKTYYKKSCEQHEYYVQRNGSGRIKVTDGFRFCEYTVETNDGKFPNFEFTTVPGGNDARDSIDLNSISGSNIEGSELVEMFDGGCWGDVEITGIDDEDEVARLEEFISEEGAYALEDDGEWYLDDTEVWVWGPLEVSDDDGNTRIVIADENGNMVDFEDS